MTFGRWAQALLYILAFGVGMGLFVDMTLLLSLLPSLFSSTTQDAVAACVAVLFVFLLIVASVSHPSVGFLVNADALLRAHAL